MSRFRHIARIGVELEGGFHVENSCDSIFSYEPKEDSSVNEGLRCCEHAWDEDGDPIETGECCHVGEIASRPLASMKEVSAFFGESYPVHVDSSCGMHVHISVRDTAVYSLLTEEVFYSEFKRELAAIGKRLNIRSRAFWSRLNGENDSYCADYWTPGAQIDGSGDRYSILNFCYHRHGTLEIRVLPMFRYAKTAFRVIEEMLLWIDSWIDAHALGVRVWSDTMVSIETDRLQPVTRERGVLCV